jgi:hypothetical protein
MELSERRKLSADVVLKRLLGFVFFAGFGQLFFSPLLDAQSVLHFPRVVSNPSVFTGLAVGNPTPAEVTVTFAAFNHDGTPLLAHNQVSQRPNCNRWN